MRGRRAGGWMRWREAAQRSPARRQPRHVLRVPRPRGGQQLPHVLLQREDGKRGRLCSGAAERRAERSWQRGGAPREPGAAPVRRGRLPGGGRLPAGGAGASGGTAIFKRNCPGARGPLCAAGAEESVRSCVRKGRVRQPAARRRSRRGRGRSRPDRGLRAGVRGLWGSVSLLSQSLRSGLPQRGRPRTVSCPELLVSLVGL